MYINQIFIFFSGFRNSNANIFTLSFTFLLHNSRFRKNASLTITAQKRCNLYLPDHPDLCFLDWNCNGIRGYENHVFVDPTFGDDSAIGNAVSQLVTELSFCSHIHSKHLKKDIVSLSQTRKICIWQEEIIYLRVRYMLLMVFRFLEDILVLLGIGREVQNMQRKWMRL